MEVHELLSYPDVMIGVVDGDAGPCSASACPVGMVLVYDLIVGIQAIHECVRLAMS